jgi:RNA polymerase sigma-70 factor (ECF subfamily)
MPAQLRADDFQSVVLPHLDAAYNLARWLVRDPVVADDVVQDAFLRATKYAATLRGHSARPWLLQIVRNAAYAYFKKRQSRMEVPLVDGLDGEEDGLDRDIPDSDPGPEDRLAHREELSLVERELDALPAVLRECVILRELEELSYKEIAQITGVPIGTVMSRLSRARQTLQKACADIGCQPAL